MRVLSDPTTFNEAKNTIHPPPHTHRHTQNLPDFTRVNAEFFVQKTTGQVVDQYGTIAGAWEKKETHQETRRVKHVEIRAAAVLEDQRDTVLMCSLSLQKVKQQIKAGDVDFNIITA